MARPPHSKGHPECPFTSWAACDKAQQMRFGQCRAVTGDREPTPCTRWAVGDNGWCWQHYASELERIKRADRIAIARAELDARIDSYMEWVREHPSVWDSKHTPKSVKRKGPHRLVSLD